MRIQRILPLLASHEDGAWPIAPWFALVVVLAASWLAGGAPAMAQATAASEPSILEQVLPELHSNYRRRQPLPRTAGAFPRDANPDRTEMEFPDRRPGLAPWQSPAYAPPGSVMQFPGLQSEPQCVAPPGCASSGGACEGSPWPSDDVPPFFARRGCPTSCGVVEDGLPGCGVPPWSESEPCLEPFAMPCDVRLDVLLQERLWGRAEFLLFWTKGAEIPALATTSPIGTAQGQAGVLGAPGTTLLFGNQTVNSNARAGGRFTLGWWLCPYQELGIEATYLTLGTATAGFHASDQTYPILAQPFLNAQTRAQDASLVAYPGLESGRLDIALNNQFYALEGLLRRAFVREPNYRADFLCGFRYARLAEGLSVNSQSTSTSVTGAVPVGTVTNVSDFFGASNQFYGADFGVATQSRRGRLSVDMLCKVALGDSRSAVSVQGQTATILPSQAPAVLPGGLLALPTNMGRHDREGFAVLPELGVNFGYQLTPRLSATFGYTVVYWSRVARPADQVDLNLNPSQFPPGQLTGAAAPQFKSVSTDFWLQGITAGLKYQF